MFDMLPTSGRGHPVHVSADLGQGHSVPEEPGLPPHLLDLLAQARVVQCLVVISVMT